jgi:hypothetical protein
MQRPNKKTTKTTLTRTQPFPFTDDTFAIILTYIPINNKVIVGRMQMISKQWTQFLHRNLQSFTWDLFSHAATGNNKVIPPRFLSHKNMFAKLSKLRSLHLIFDKNHSFTDLPYQITAALVRETTLTSLTLTDYKCNKKETAYFKSLTNLTYLKIDKMSYESGGMSILRGVVLPKLLTLSIHNASGLRYCALAEYAHYGRTIATNFTSLQVLELKNTDVLMENERKELAKSCNVTLNGVKL